MKTFLLHIVFCMSKGAYAITFALKHKTLKRKLGE